MKKERLLIYSTVFLIMGLSNSVIPVLPEIAAGSLVSSGTISYTLLFSGYFIGALLTMIPFGFMADIYDNVKIMIFSITLTLFAGIVLILSENIYLLIGARLLEGIACGAFFPPAYSLLAGFTEKNRYIGEFNFLLNAGLAVGVLSSGFLAAWSIRGAIILFTGLSIIILLLGTSVVFTGKRPGKIQVKNISPSIEAKNVISKLFDLKFIRIWITAFLIFGITGVMLAFYPEYSKDLLSKPELGVAIAILYASSMITNIVVGRMNLGFRKMIFSGILLAAAGVVISLKAPFIGFALLGIGSGTGMIGLPVAVSHMPVERGLAMGIFNTYTYAGLAFMPIIAGMFVGMGYQTVFILSAAFMVLSLFLKDGVESGE
ncbi:MFS transporter [Methanolobus profundi]|uniref:Predicted arabinose efflux permease, MFS family n=1 Tax=Methanolobus profundi TaxID=487685 RepID=A0A1I4PQM2_9EURY|nr:MFS transporter [Methanolobus profundi]SFM29896.1 Predicted arabinose efflux permease, MFS family [Methanolobus profundi]